MKKQIDITGKVFTRLTAINSEYCKKGGQYYWRFKCECGNEVIHSKSNVIRGDIKSCGCLRKDRFLTHGMGDMRFYGIWEGMKVRCNHYNRKNSKYYTKKGIKVCNDWKKFDNFRDHMYQSYLKHVTIFGEKNTTIDRINYLKNYEAGNCKWSTLVEQANNKSNNHVIVFKGIELTLPQWARKNKIDPETLRNRILYLGWDIKRALTTLVRKQKNNSIINQ